MASLDYTEAKKEIEKLFKKPGNERKVVFWYDSNQSFKGDLTEDEIAFCRVLLCEGNEFAIKKIVEHDDTDTDFLIYVPSEKPKDSENWLLDILCYSEEYYADTVALTMRRLGLSNPYLRSVIERHDKFFGSEARIKKLSGYTEISDSMDGKDLAMAMLCVLTKSADKTIEGILTELVFDDGDKYADVCKFGFEDFLWDNVCDYYNYEGDLKISVLIKKFLFTAFLEQTNEFINLPSFYGQYTIEGQGRMDAKFFVDKIKSDSRYELLQEEMAQDLKIEGLLTSRDIISVQDADIFECIDFHIINTVIASLNNGSLDYELLERVLTNRYNSMWHDKLQAQYETLSSAIHFLKLIEKPIRICDSATDYIRAYTDKYYEIDTYYRRACTNYRRIEMPRDDMSSLITMIDGEYQCKFLDAIGKKYSDALSKQNTWDFIGIDKTEGFYNRVQKNNYKKVFVIISDGLRYEAGFELFEKIKVDPILKGTVNMDFAVSPLPSETRMGMAALLPHKELTYSAGKVEVDGMPTNDIDARDAVLKKKNASYAAIKYEKINGFNRSELRSYMADKSMVYIYHNVIDNTGEHQEDKVFDSVPTAIDEILLLIRKLYNSLLISNFFVTADHGFLYRRKQIDESSKYGNILAQNAPEASKRYVLMLDGKPDIPYSTSFVMHSEDNPLTVVTPYSYDIFKTHGSGIQYVHGGSSLQETIVPIIHIGELSSSKNNKEMSFVEVRLKSIVRKITNRSFTLEFEQCEKVEERKLPVTCLTYIVDENNVQVSGEYRFIANSTNDDPDTRITKIRFALKNIEFDRNKRYYLILKNLEEEDEYIEREQFTIDILSFKMF